MKNCQIQRYILGVKLVLWAIVFLPAYVFADTTITTFSRDTRVTVIDDEKTWTLDNGIVRAVIHKENAGLLNLFFQGIDVTGHEQGRPGVWEQDPSAAAKVGGLTQALTIDPNGNEGERAEVSIKGITKGNPTAGLTPNSPGQGPQGTVNLDLEIRYSLARGESGVYTYAIFSHPPEYGPLNIPESRFITRLNQAFDWISVDEDRNMLQCAPRDWGTGVVVHAKEQRIMSQGVYKNSVEHKYSYSAVQSKIPAFGWSSTKHRIGAFLINPSIEYLSGGASKQELTCHFGDNSNPTPIILNYWRGTHYGGGATASIAAGEKWSKVIGPMMIYVNALDKHETPSPEELETLDATSGNPTVPRAWQANCTALWRDALRQSQVETSKWPYEWVKVEDYRKLSERGSVEGQLVLRDPQAASTKLPQLTVGLAPPFPGDFLPLRTVKATSEPASIEPTRFNDSGFGRGRRVMDWAHDAKHYQFWSNGTEDGKFSIQKVIPGTYTLHAFAEGVLGEFARAEVIVEAGKTTQLGQLTWTPLRLGKQVWEIGYPSRAADKFFKGDGSNYWLWGWGLRYPLLFPNDIVYTVGTSDYRKDWFFQQTPRATSKAFLNPEAKDPANQRFGWVKAESLEQYPQSNTAGPWEIYGRGTATTWTIRFDMDRNPRGQAALRVSLGGADLGAGLKVGINGMVHGNLPLHSTNSLRYNTNKSVWQEVALLFDASVLHTGTNEISLTVPAGELTSGVTYDYLRLELDEDATKAASP